MLLGRCEFGKEDYSFNIIDMPREVEEEPFVPIGPSENKKVKGKKKIKKDEEQTSLF